jgi:hypothetical protein
MFDLDQLKKAEMFAMKLTLQLHTRDIASLINDVLMARQHGPHSPEHNYQWELLRDIARKHPVGFQAGLEEARHVWAEPTLERLLDTLGDAQTVYQNIVSRVQAMQPGDKRWWPLTDPDQITTIIRTLKDAGITTHVSSGRLTVER